MRTSDAAATARACSSAFSSASVASPRPRRARTARARRHAGGVGERFVRRAKKQRVGLSLGLVPFLVDERPLDRVAPEPEWLWPTAPFASSASPAANAAPRLLARVLRQREQTVDERTRKAGSGLLGDLPPARASASASPLRPWDKATSALWRENHGLVATRLHRARLLQRVWPGIPPLPRSGRLPSGRGRATAWRTFAHDGCRS